jgi:hypothetical protein
MTSDGSPSARFQQALKTRNGNLAHPKTTGARLGDNIG